MTVFTPIFVILLSYALGCIAVGYYLVRWRTGQDVRQIGSGATGGRNVGLVLGAAGTIITGLGDLLKGALAMAIALRVKLDLWALALVMIAVLAGHVWPMQLRFKGGKGLSTAFGSVFVYDYRIALITLLIVVPLFFLSRRNEFVFLIGVAGSPVIAFLLGYGWQIVAGMVVVVAIIWYAHRDNIRASLKPQTTSKGE